MKLLAHSAVLMLMLEEVCSAHFESLVTFFALCDDRFHFPVK